MRESEKHLKQDHWTGSRNLKLLCSEHASVADVCRKIGINRQQFNKYLSGKSSPSARNLSRICEFFGVEVSELKLPHSELAALRKSYRRNQLISLSDPEPAFDMDDESVRELGRYCGIYRTYNMLPYVDNNILVGFSVIKRVGDRFVSKYIEHIKIETAFKESTQSMKMLGSVCIEGGFIYLLDHIVDTGAGAGPGYTLTILHTSRREPINYVVGMALGVAGHMGGSPYSAKIVYERLPDDINVRPILKSLGRYASDDPAIPEEVKRLIDNKMANEQTVLTFQSI